MFSDYLICILGKTGVMHSVSLRLASSEEKRNASYLCYRGWIICIRNMHRVSLIILALCMIKGISKDLGTMNKFACFCRPLIFFFKKKTCFFV